MAAVNYAEQYAKALAQTYPYTLYFGDLYNSPNNSKYKVVDAKTIKIPVMTVNGRKDADRDTIGTFSRNHNNNWETKTLTNLRSWETLVHPLDVNQSNMVMSIQNATKTFNEEQKFPEMDAYCVSKIFADANTLDATTTVDSTTILTVENILSTFDKYMQDMDEHRVPQTGRILYVTPTIKTMLKQAKEIVRNVSVDSNTTMINRSITRLDEVKIVSVPSELMQTVFDFTSGWVKGASAQAINMLLIHPTAVYTPVVYSFSGMEAPSAHTKGKYLYYEESAEDVFILNNRKYAIKFNVTASSTPTDDEDGGEG